MIDVLRRRSIEAVWVSNEILPGMEVRQAVRHETREVARAALANVFGAITAKRGLDNATVRQMVSAVHSLVDEIMESQDVAVNLTHLRGWDNYTFEHSIQVSILSLVIGKAMQLNKDQLVRLGTGAILHDVGKLFTPIEILTKPDKLTDEEFDVIKRHPKEGWDLVHEQLSSVMPTSSIIVLEHHERLDGSGYPNGKTGDQIYHFSKIVAVADVFDAIRADRTYRQKHTPSKVMDIMVGDAMRGKLDKEMVFALLKHAALVPQGEIVRLSNGVAGIVTEVNAEDMIRPVVTIIGDPDDNLIAPEKVSLQGTGVFVQSILNDWPDKIKAAVAEGGLANVNV